LYADSLRQANAYLKEKGFENEQQLDRRVKDVEEELNNNEKNMKEKMKEFEKDKKSKQ